MSPLALSDSFEYLWYGSTIIHIITFTTRGSTLDVRIWRVQSSDSDVSRITRCKCYRQRYNLHNTCFCTWVSLQLEIASIQQVLDNLLAVCSCNFIIPHIWNLTVRPHIYRDIPKLYCAWVGRLFLFSSTYWQIKRLVGKCTTGARVLVQVTI